MQDKASGQEEGCSPKLYFSPGACSLCGAINRFDIETAMTLYEPEAALVAQPGNVVIGTKARRDALAGFIALKPTITTEAHRFIQAGDVALYCSKVES